MVSEVEKKTLTSVKFRTLSIGYWMLEIGRGSKSYSWREYTDWCIPVSTKTSGYLQPKLDSVMVDGKR